MKSKKTSTTTLIALLFFAGVNAQTTTQKVVKTAHDVNYTTGAVNNSVNAASNSVRTIDNAKKTFESLFKGKKKDDNQTVIVIAGIEFDDENLSLLKEEISKVKGVKSASLEYKSGTAMIEASYKGKPGNLWEAVPKHTRQLFKLMEAGDNNIILEYKNPKISIQNTSGN